MIKLLFSVASRLSIQFEYRALSSTPGRMAHALICMELSGFGTKALTVTRTLAKAEFFVPTVSFCPSSVYFR